MSTYFESKKQWRIEFLGFSVGVYKPLNEKLKEINSPRPYVNFSFSDLKYQTRRKTIWALHRARYGWAAPDTWSFDYYLADVIIGGLKHLRDNKTGIPSQLMYGKKINKDEHGMAIEAYTIEQAEARWDKIMDEIIEGFESHKQLLDGHKTIEEDDQLKKKFDHGMKLFAKYYGSFWD
jgi:hypothetical protein